MRREKFLDSQVIRTGFYSCSEHSREVTASFETDFRHQTGFLGSELRGESSKPVRKKIRIIRKAFKKTESVRFWAEKKSQNRKRA